MKKHLFRIIAVLSAAVLLAGCAASRLRLGAAAAGGVYNAFGTAMSAQNSAIEVKQTAGSAANLRLLAGGYLQLAVAQSDMAQDAYDGSGIFAHESTERSFSAVAALYEEAVQVIVRADSGITTLEELQGCTLSVGEEESGTEQNAGQVLAACGLNNRLVHTVNLNYTDAAARLADGTIAGSATNLYLCMQKAISFGIPMEQAIRSATIIPARQIGREAEIGSIEPGKLADFVVCAPDLTPKAVYLGGKIVE